MVAAGRPSTLHYVSDCNIFDRFSSLQAVEETPCFLLGKYFGKFKNGQKKCPKTNLPKYFPQNTCFVTIIEIYGLVTEKITQNLLW